MDIIQDIFKNILSTFFDRRQVREFKEAVSRTGIFSITPQKGENKTTKRQPEFDKHTKTFPEYIDLLKTFAARKLISPKYVELMLYLGEVCIAHGELEIASQIYSGILSEVTKEDRLENITAYSLLSLAEIYGRQAKWIKSIRYIKDAKKLFSRQNDFKGIAKCNNMLGTIYGDRGNIKKAKEYFEESLSFLNPSFDSSVIGIIETNIGILNSIRGDYDESLLYYQRALIKYEQRNDTMHISQLRHNLGMLHTQKGEYQAALQEFDKSISISMKAEYLPNLALSYLSKSYIFAKSDDLPMASAYADKSFDLCKKLNDRLSIADIYKIKGIIERKQKHYDASENYFLTSLRLNTELQNMLNHAETLSELSELYLEINRTKDATGCIIEALKDYKKMGADRHVKELTERLNMLI